MMIKNRFQRHLPHIFFLLLVIFGVFQIASTFSLRFLSDDLELVLSSLQNKQLWHLHFSPILELFWKGVALKWISLFYFRVFIAAFHLVNTALLFYVAKNLFSYSHFLSLSLALLFFFNPLAVEALVWTCCFGYILTMTLLLLNFYVLAQYQKGDLKKTKTLFILFFLQILGFFIWDWTVVVFPILALFVFFNKKDFLCSLFPIASVWLLAVCFRYFSHYGNAWQNNSIFKIITFVFGSPLVGMMPNVNKEFFSSVYAILILIGLWSYFFYLFYQKKMSRFYLFSYLITIAPWAFGGNPSGRYFYLSMPFVYFLLVSGSAVFFNKYLRYLFSTLLLVLTAYFSHQRFTLWHQAERESYAILDQLKALDIPKNTVLINVPDILGPDSLAMRPQMWYSGFEFFFPEAVRLFTDDTFCVWKKRTCRYTREELFKKNLSSPCYEIKETFDGSHMHFVVVPFKPEL